MEPNLERRRFQNAVVNGGEGGEGRREGGERREGRVRDGVCWLYDASGQVIK
jgi:hypothetical protein